MEGALEREHHPNQLSWPDAAHAAHAVHAAQGVALLWCFIAFGFWGQTRLQAALFDRSRALSTAARFVAANSRNHMFAIESLLQVCE
jgi:hypothetical protein